MSALLWIGAGLAGLAIAGLGWCIARAARLRRSQASPEETRAALQGLVALNLASVALGGLGLALMIAGGLL